MIERAVSARVPFAWVAADEVYGDNGPLRTWLEQQHLAYVLAVARDHRVPAGVGRTVRADELAARLPRRAWQRLSAGDGAKGHRWYDWAWVTISNPGLGHRCLLIRRNRSTGELAFYHCYSPQRVTLAALVKVAGLRWTIEENFQACKGLTGLDEHQVRRWNSWHRWVTLAMLGAAVLTIAAAIESPRPGRGRADPSDPQRDRPPPRRSDCPTGPRRRAPPPLVTLATPPPAPRPDLPLPAANNPRPCNITIYGWSTRRNRRDAGSTVHNPEVAGSNPAPATRSEAQGGQPRTSFHGSVNGIRLRRWAGSSEARKSGSGGCPLLVSSSSLSRYPASARSRQRRSLRSLRQG